MSWYLCFYCCCCCCSKEKLNLELVRDFDAPTTNSNIRPKSHILSLVVCRRYSERWIFSLCGIFKVCFEMVCVDSQCFWWPLFGFYLLYVFVLMLFLLLLFVFLLLLLLLLLLSLPSTTIVRVYMYIYISFLWISVSLIRPYDTTL